MNELTYCPQCGKSGLRYEESKKWSCTACGFVLYNNCASAVAVVLQHRKDILLTRRKNKPGMGLLDLPGGFSDPMETAEQTCKREIWEELQIDLNPDSLCYLGSRPNKYLFKAIEYSTMDLFFRYDLLEKPKFLMCSEELSEVVWVPLKELDLNELAFESQRNFLKQYTLA
ncbi:NUDIX hydrolase [Planobacterium oryzisoli]|uniref:NUDIX domain-containing protein n=1 Tax=Planobacterium oryzisoli TaxID=2771435 RepID=A0A931EB93_9FLAO|nr:NUDIX domain-containing protein [Planobacterium oryzisoli]MBF5027878.1 NUDIX domain-containing protein [Planobacterium oryzisoli]